MDTPFLVNVALVDDASIAAVSADPIADEVFWTDGHGAFRRHDGSDETLVPSAESRLVDVNCDGPIERPSVRPQLLADLAFRSAFGPRMMSTTLAVAWVAAGRRAGCVVTDLLGDKLKDGRGLLVAADDETHRRLVEIIGPYLGNVSAAAG